MKKPRDCEINNGRFECDADHVEIHGKGGDMVFLYDSKEARKLAKKLNEWAEWKKGRK